MRSCDICGQNNCSCKVTEHERDTPGKRFKSNNLKDSKKMTDLRNNKNNLICCVDIGAKVGTKDEQGDTEVVECMKNDDNKMEGAEAVMQEVVGEFGSSSSSDSMTTSTPIENVDNF